jgi:hypothetical protein
VSADVRRRQEWCQRWLERQHVRNPQLTPEWRQLLDDSVALLAENERLREALREIADESGCLLNYAEIAIRVRAALAAPSTEADA